LLTSQLQSHHPLNQRNQSNHPIRERSQPLMLRLPQLMEPKPPPLNEMHEIESLSKNGNEVWIK